MGGRIPTRLAWVLPLSLSPSQFKQPNPHTAHTHGQARNVEQFNEKYADEVLAFVEEAGFTGFFRKPRATVQTADCLYSSAATAAQPAAAGEEEQEAGPEASPLVVVESRRRRNLVAQ